MLNELEREKATVAVGITLITVRSQTITFGHRSFEV
jgi:hypothetical protein